MPSIVKLALRTTSAQGGSRGNRDVVVGVVLLMILALIVAVTVFVWRRRRVQQSDEEPSKTSGEFEANSPSAASPAQVEPPTLTSIPEVHFRVPFPRPRLVPGPRRPIIPPDDTPVRRVHSPLQPQSRPPNLKLLTTPEVLGPPPSQRGSTYSRMNTPALPSSVWKSEAQDRWVRATRILRSPLRGRRAATPNPMSKKEMMIVTGKGEKNRMVGDGRAKSMLSMLITDMKGEYKEAL